MPRITLTVPTDHPNLLTVLTLLGVALPGSSTTTPPAAAPAIPLSAGSYADATGLAVLDDAGAAVVADPRNASLPYLAGLRLLASQPNLLETALMKAVGAATPTKLAGHKAATTKRVKAALGGKAGAVLFRIEQGKVVVAEETRKALARYFNLPTI